MTDDHDPEEPIVTEVLELAQQTVKHFSTIFQSMGWDAIVLSLTRVVEVSPGDFHAPGATATVIDKPRCGPVAGQLAAVLRKQADMLDALTEGEEVTSGYIQDQSDHASGLSEWPK